MNKVNIGKIKVGDKFSTEQKLLSTIGFEKARDNSKKAQIKEMQRYLAYKKTGKITRGKVTNEIVITEIFEEVKDKVDGRIGKGNNTNTGKYRQYLMPLLKMVPLQTVKIISKKLNIFIRKSIKLIYKYIRKLIDIYE